MLSLSFVYGFDFVAVYGRCSLQAAHEAGSSAEDKKDLLMARLAELLDGEDATLSAVKEKLVLEFGKKYVFFSLILCVLLRLFLPFFVCPRWCL